MLVINFMTISSNALAADYGIAKPGANPAFKCPESAYSKLHAANLN